MSVSDRHFAKYCVEHNSSFSALSFFGVISLSLFVSVSALMGAHLFRVGVLLVDKVLGALVKLLDRNGRAARKLGEPRLPLGRRRQLAGQRRRVLGQLAARVLEQRAQRPALVHQRALHCAVRSILSATHARLCCGSRSPRTFGAFGKAVVRVGARVLELRTR